MEENNTGKIDIKKWFKEQKQKAKSIITKFKEANVSIDQQSAFWAFIIMDSVLSQNLTAEQRNQIQDYLDKNEFENAVDLLWKIYNKEV